MMVGLQQPRTRQSHASWPALALAWCCSVTLGCSPRSSAADAAGLADAGVDAGFDVGADMLDSTGDTAPEVQDIQTAEVGDVLESEAGDGAEVVDAITDAVGGDAPDVEVVQIDIQIFDATPAVDAAAACSATAIPAPLTGTVEFEAAAYISNPVVMGCGKGPPKSVKAGTAGCCNCAPPYSCYCNGECGWLRAPDLVKPQHYGQAVWTGKWVVSLGEAAQQYKSPSSMNLQKWQPGSGKGFELVPLPSPGLMLGTAVVMLFDGKVLVGVSCCGGGSSYSPNHPVYLYDPDTDVFTTITMPFCGKLLLSGGTLVCVAAGESTVKGSNPGLHLYDSSLGIWGLVQPPAALVPQDWFIIEPDNSVADDDAIYLVRVVRSYLAWPDGTTEFPGAGHILKFSPKAQKWADIGMVPTEWHYGVLVLDHQGIVRVKNGIQAARFRLDTFKWEVGPKFSYTQFGYQEPTLTPCGLLFGSGTLNTVFEGGGMSYRPALLASDLSWKLLSPWGYPNDAITSRKGPNTVLTDKEVFALGGYDGPPQGNFVYHNDSYRYPLSALCDNGGSK